MKKCRVLDICFKIWNKLKFILNVPKTSSPEQRFTLLSAASQQAGRMVHTGVQKPLLQM